MCSLFETNTLIEDVTRYIFKLRAKNDGSANIFLKDTLFVRI